MPNQLKELKEFRAKLVKARVLARHRDFDHCIAAVCEEAGLKGLITDVEPNCTVPEQTWSWYWYASPTLRAAMWDNSIAALDAQIAQIGKEGRK